MDRSGPERTIADDLVAGLFATACQCHFQIEPGPDRLPHRRSTADGSGDVAASGCPDPQRPPRNCWRGVGSLARADTAGLARSAGTRLEDISAPAEFSNFAARRTSHVRLGTWRN